MDKFKEKKFETLEIKNTSNSGFKIQTFIDKDERDDILKNFLSNDQKHSKFLEKLKLEKESHILRDMVDFIFSLG